MVDVLVSQPRYVLEGGELDETDFADIGTCTDVIWEGADLLVRFSDASLTQAQIDEVVARVQAPYLPVSAPTPVAPTTSPTPEAHGGVREVLLTLPPVFNESAIQAEIYVGTSPSVPLDATHLHGIAEGTTYPIYALPAGLGGTPLTDLPEGTPIYIVAQATNAAGDAPPSSEVSATLRKLDQPDFTVGYLYAGEVQVDQLRGDKFTLGEGTVDTIEAVGVNGERLGMSVLKGLGFYSFGKPEVAGEQGPVRVWFPIDGKPNIVSGQSEFDDATINRTLTLHGTTTLAPGAKFILGGQVQAPKTAPLVDINWHTVQHDYTVSASMTEAGLTRGHDGRWYAALSTQGAAIEDANVVAVNDDGTSPQTIPLDDAYLPLGGIVYASHHGGRYYLLVQAVSNGDWYIEARNTSMAFLYRKLVAGAADHPNTPAIGWDHVNGVLLRARAWSDGTVAVYGYNWDANGNSVGAVPTWQTPSAYAYTFDLAYVARVNTEYGDRYVFRRSGAGGQDFQVFTPAGAHQTSEEWPATGSVYGAWYDGTRFWSVSGAAKRFRYETGRAMWTSGSATREIQSTLWTGNRTFQATRTNASNVLTSAGLFLPSDQGRTITGTGIPAGTTVLLYQDANTVLLSANATSGAPTTGSVTIARTAYETNPSPKASVVMLKRARLTVTVGDIPLGAGGDADAIGARIYVGVGTNVANASMVREKTIISPNTAWSLDSVVAAETGAPPTSNSFPNATPSDLETTSGGVRIESDGDGDVGTAGLRESIRAALRGDYPAGVWTSYTPTWTASTTNPTLGNGSIVGRYIQIGKTVHFTIVLTVGSTTNLGSGNYLFGLPVTARDGDGVVVTGIANAPNTQYIGRGGLIGAPAGDVRLFLAGTTNQLQASNSGYTSGTGLRISGTYEAA